MILDAPTLTAYQRCRRQFLLGLEWEPVRTRPKRLFDIILAKSIRRIANGDADVPRDAYAEFMTVAADPGLDAPGDTYRVAKEWSTLLEVILRCLERRSLGQLTTAPARVVAEEVEWRPSSPVDADGRLHRWVTVARWDDAAIARELHSWYVTGDIAVVRRPIAVHAIEIGSVRRIDRRSSLWVRGFQHPGIPRQAIRFAAEHSDLSSWTKVWLIDRTDQDLDQWVEWLTRDGIPDMLIYNVTVNVPSVSQCSSVLKDIVSEAIDIQRLRGSDRRWYTYPMSRTACDGIVPCHFQHCCYVEEPGVVKLEEMEMLYRKRPMAPVTAAAATGASTSTPGPTLVVRQASPR